MRRYVALIISCIKLRAVRPYAYPNPQAVSCKIMKWWEDQTDTEKSLRKKQRTWIHEILKPKNLQQIISQLLFFLTPLKKRRGLRSISTFFWPSKNSNRSQRRWKVPWNVQSKCLRWGKGLRAWGFRGWSWWFLLLG